MIETSFNMSIVKIAIVNYQAGNIRSVAKAIEKAGVTPVITDDPEVVKKADGLVFPGQGAIDPAMRALKDKKLADPIKDFIQSGKPFLGICLGLQLLLDSSEEGIERGMSLIKGTVRRFPPRLKIPHIGWNNVKLVRQIPLFHNIPKDSRFYFVHSYYADPLDSFFVGGLTNYGLDFCSVVAYDNVVATQFHPEKSGAIGLRIYQNFVNCVLAGGY
jgi:glutamine amidotransferase